MRKIAEIYLDKRRIVHFDDRLNGKTTSVNLDSDDPYDILDALKWMIFGRHKDDYDGTYRHPLLPGR